MSRSVRFPNYPSELTLARAARVFQSGLFGVQEGSSLSIGNVSTVGVDVAADWLVEMHQAHLAAYRRRDERGFPIPVASTTKRGKRGGRKH